MQNNVIIHLLMILFNSLFKFIFYIFLNLKYVFVISIMIKKVIILENHTPKIMHDGFLEFRDALIVIIVVGINCIEAVFININKN